MKQISSIAFGALLLLFSISTVCCGNNDNNGNNGQIPTPPISPTDYSYRKPTAASIRLLTYNSFYCKSNTADKTFSDAHTRQFADVIRALDADIVAIQELDSAVASRGKRYLLQQIKEATGIDYDVFFGSAASFDGGRIGCGLLVKKSIGVSRVTYVPLDGDERRMLIIAQLPKFTVMATHLDLNNSKRKASATTICNEVSHLSGPVFLLGDLNDSFRWKPEVSAFPVLSAYFSILSATDGSLPDSPGETIDYVLLHQTTASKIVKKGSTIVKRLSIDGAVKDISTVSDHYPVFVDIEVAP